jgi:glutaredoxin 3
VVAVDIYTSRSCPYCIRAKDLLNEKGVRFRELLVDGNPEYISEAVRRSGGRRTVPQIFIENYHVGGYDELFKLDIDGKLDSMLGLNAR